MTGDRWHDVERVFERALELPPAERAPYVDETCGEDRALYVEVMGLLASDDEARRSLRRVVRAAARRLGLTRDD